MHEDIESMDLESQGESEFDDGCRHTYIETLLYSKELPMSSLILGVGIVCSFRSSFFSCCWLIML
jgi:hypothetical protein